MTSLIHGRDLSGDWVGYRRGAADVPVAHILLVQVTYTEGEPEIYVLPVAFADGGRETPGPTSHAIASVCVTGTGSEEKGVRHDAMVDPRFSLGLSISSPEAGASAGDSAK